MFGSDLHSKSGKPSSSKKVSPRNFIQLLNSRRNPAVLVGVGLGSADELSCVDEDLLDVGVVVGRNGFVTRTEVEDLTAASLVGAAAAEYFAAAEPADEDEFVGLGNEEVFAVGFFVFDTEIGSPAAKMTASRAL